MSNKAKMSLRKAGMAAALAVAMVLPCAALVGNAAGIEDLIEVSASRAVMHRYEIRDFVITDTYYAPIKVTTRNYHELGKTQFFSGIQGTYEKEESNASIKFVLENAYQMVGLTTSVDYDIPSITLSANYNPGYYQIIYYLKVADVSFELIEYVNEDVGRLLQDGRSSVPYETCEWEAWLNYYETYEQESPSWRSLILSNE